MPTSTLALARNGWLPSSTRSAESRAHPAKSYWQDTAILIAWDDWGGWFDHVKPVENNISGKEWGSGYTYGFRVPLLVVSAYTPAHFVSNDVFDFGSILAFTEKNFSLGFIGPGNAPYGRYADYHAAQKPFGDLSTFFGLAAPKAFVPIKVVMRPQDFLNAPTATRGPDND